MFINRVGCSENEKNELTAYLSMTPVSWLNRIIESGASVEKATIESLQHIGSLQTIFECLGGIKCQDQIGTKRFLVSQVFDALQSPSCTDKSMLDTILLYKQLKSQGCLEIKITIFECSEGVIVFDGNKRAVACLQQANEKNQETVLPVYIVTQPP
jgi:hypothetical protein